MGRRPKVERHQWVEAALVWIGEQGVSALAVEPLARRLSVTKGSFYGYFGGLDELVIAAASMWAAQVIATLTAAHEAPLSARERLHRFLAVRFSDRPALRIEAALAFAAAAEDTRVRPIFEKVSHRRLAILRQTYRDFGLPPARARHYAEGLYATYLGTLQLLTLERMVFTTPRSLEVHLAQLEEIFLPQVSHAAPSQNNVLGTT